MVGMAGILGAVTLLWWHAGAADAAARVTLAPDPTSADIARQFDRVLPRAHLSHQPLDASLATNALQIYLTMLDYDRTYFMASDVAEFEQEAGRLADRLATGDVDFAFRVFERLRERVRNRVEYVDTLLTKGFDLTARESYFWKRKDAPWSATAAGYDELWRRKIKNEYVARIVSQRLADEERTNAAARAVAVAPPAEAATNEAAIADALLSPEEFIRKRYKQYLIVLDDSDADFVLQRYFTAFAQAYDPHSEYMTASSSEDFDISMKLSLVGIGALLSNEDGAAKIEKIIKGGPADHDGRLKAGDRIIAVAQGNEPPVDVLHWPLYKTVRLIRGEKGTKVVLTVIPVGGISGSRTIKVTLVRAEVKLEEQAAKGDVRKVAGQNGVSNKVGVIRLPAFYADIRNRMNGGTESRSSTRDVAALVSDMKAKQVAGILIDLRNNGGGSLAEAVEMTGLFLTSGPVVQVREVRGIQVLSDPDPDVLYAGPLVVLVNRHSASASEILAAALQDYGRAVLVGDSKTHGKGTVQSLQYLDERHPKLGQIKVTTHSFYRIAGGSTQLKGVAPDLVIPSVLDALDVGEEFLPHAMQWTVVNMALYRPVIDLKPLVPSLRRWSETRRAGDPRFQVQADIIKRIYEHQEAAEISLNLEDRMTLAHEEKGLEAAQREALDGDGEEPAGEDQVKREHDIVLVEAERILADLITLTTKEKTNDHSVLEDARRGQ
jgi:carboxyl-terminal processing protease